MFGQRQGGGGGSRPVCKFFLEGRCRFGDNCKNEHPRETQGQAANSNRFAALSNGNGSGSGTQGGFGNGGTDRYRPNDNRPLPFQLDRNNIRKDLTIGGTDGEKPTWPLSAYGPGKDAPLELIDAEFEKSPEELRVLYYVAKASGNPQTLQEYEQGEASLVSGANAKAQYVLNNLDNALEYVLRGRNTDKDRNQQTKSSSNHEQQGIGHNPTSIHPNTGFGMQSASQSNSGGFAAFGQSSQAGASSFGKTPALGGTGVSVSTPAFGAPSVPGAQNSAFGTSGGARPAFGAPSAFGASARAQGPTFGSSSSMGTQPSPFAIGTQNQSQQANGFGSASPFSSVNAQPKALGAAQTQQSAFGSTGFGQPSQPTGNTGGGFGQVSQPGSGGFVQPSQSGGIGGFGQASKIGSSGGFGQASQRGPTVSPFASKPQQNISPFGQPGNSIPQSNAGSGFGAPSQLGGENTFGSQSQPQPPRNAFESAKSASADAPAHPQVNDSRGSSDATRDGSGKLLKWKGLPVRYDAQGAPLYQDPNTGRTERIWIEKGPPPSHPDFEGPVEAYQGETGRVLKEMYDFLRETNTFKDGLIPEIPPKREWIRWDV